MLPLTRVTHAAARRASADAEYRAAIIAASEAGHSLRQIADVAEVSHVRVLNILRGDPPRDPVYEKAHRAVDKARGKPKECEVCGTTDPERTYEWASLSGRYDDPTDYARMDRKCHRAFDRLRRDNPELDHVGVLKILRGE